MPVSPDPIQGFSVALGNSLLTGALVLLSDLARRSGLYVLGKPGTGKTTLLLLLALQDIAHGHGVFFQDPHKDAIDKLIAHMPSWRVRDVVLVDPLDPSFSVGINPLAVADPSDFEATLVAYNRTYGIFHSLWWDTWGVWLQTILSNTLYAFLENPGFTLADVPLFLTNSTFRSELVRNITRNPRVAEFWRDEFGTKREVDQQREVESAINRVDQLLTHPVVRHILAQPKTTLDFTTLMQERKIVLVRLSKHALSADVQRFLGTILVSELLAAAYAREKLPEGERHQFVIIIDEFQNFATADIAPLLTEARKFGIALTIAHQERSGQLVDPQVLGATQAALNKVTFQTSTSDSKVMAPEYARLPEAGEPRKEVRETIARNPVEKLITAEHPNRTIKQFSVRHLLELTQAIEQAPWTS